VRTAPEYGHIYDHFAIDYEYESGVHMTSMCRQIPNCQNSVSEALHGTSGFYQVDRWTVTGAKPRKFSTRDIEEGPYIQEHTDLIAGIRAGNPENELKEGTESTLTATMGRMSAYTGKLVTWEQALSPRKA
jgi:hypothetical protein